MTNTNVWAEYEDVLERRNAALDSGDWDAYMALENDEARVTAIIDGDHDRTAARIQQTTSPAYNSANEQIRATKERLAAAQKAVAAVTSGASDATATEAAEAALERGALAEDIRILEERLPYVGKTDADLITRSQDLAADIEEAKEELAGLQGAKQNARRRRAEGKLKPLEDELAALTPELWIRGEEQTYERDLAKIAEYEASKARTSKLQDKESHLASVEAELKSGAPYSGQGPVIDALRVEIAAQKDLIATPITGAEIAEHAAIQRARSTPVRGAWRLG